jgi:aspartate carbamoyltransferase regulatory subunit
MKEKNRPSEDYAQRWAALLAENSILHKEHVDLLSSFTPPFSVEQIAQLKVSAARFGSLPPKIQQLVEDWAKSRPL